MSDLPPAEATPHLSTLQQRISIVTWLLTLLLSMRGLYAFYGMKEKGFLELLITVVTEPIVQLFQFASLSSSDIPGMSVLFATVSVLLISYTARAVIKFTEVRLVRSREVKHQPVFRHAINSHS